MQIQGQKAGNYPNYDDHSLSDWSRKSFLNLVNARAGYLRISRWINWKEVSWEGPFLRALT